MDVCYCEHKNGKTPNNGIMCGTYGGDFFRDGYCSTHQTCTGGTKDDWGKNWVTKNKKGDLCKSSNQLMIVFLNDDFLRFTR